MSEDYDGLVTRLKSPRYSVETMQAAAEAASAISSLCERVEALTAETCDLTGRLDIARQERGIAEAQVEALERERDAWKKTTHDIQEFRADELERLGKAESALALAQRELADAQEPWQKAENDLAMEQCLRQQAEAALAALKSLLMEAMTLVAECRDLCDIDGFMETFELDRRIARLKEQVAKETS